MKNKVLQRPRTMAYSYHLTLFVKARWLAIAGALCGLVFSQFILTLQLGYTWLYSILALMIVYNTGFLLALRQINFHEDFICNSPECRQGAKQARTIAWMQIIFDLVALFFILHLSGGLTNPFVIFFLLHMAASTLLLETKGIVFIFALITVLLFSLGILEKTQILHHYQLDKIYGPLDPLDSWLFVLGLPAIITLLNICLTALLFFIMNAINKNRDKIIDLSEQLEEKNQNLLRLDGRRKQTMAVVSHDLKSPIDAVTSYLNMMDQGYLGQMSEKQLEIVKKCINRLRRLRDFISDVLDWQTIEHGEIQQVMEPVSLKETLLQSIQDYKDQAEQKQITLNVDIPQQLPLVNASLGRMAQVFNNLLSNAVKYTLNNGEVFITAQKKDQDLLFSIKDTGIGMDEEEISNLFQDFYRSPKVKKDFEGTGLGLSVVRRIIQAHKGEIWAESKPKTGTTFFITLPLYTK